ncbi:MAG: DUF5320 domain-containing protein [Fischerella sp.]|uniref:hypothetical protein n=1 Tax=Fischerella sp. TaxID=1191 RepID=UPI001799C5F8|nr:hypothetical protein [Fischerella sp.]NWF58846.1 DUF5320 domain-containing protein [Fischerella sp.]
MSENPVYIGIETTAHSTIQANANAIACILAFNGFMDVANNLLIPLPSKQLQKKIRRHRVKQKAQSQSQETKNRLQAEIATLKQELAALKQEKAELSSLLAITTKHKSPEALWQSEELLRRQMQEMQIEIDLNQVARQVAEITKTDYFQQLQIEVEHLRNSEVADDSC